MRISASFQLQWIALYRLALVLYIYSFVAFCPSSGFFPVAFFVLVTFCPGAFCPGLVLQEPWV